jgi:hypothetical protein
MNMYSSKREVVFIESEETYAKSYWPWNSEADSIYRLLGYNEDQPVDEARLELISGAMDMLGVNFRVYKDSIAASLKSY